MTVWCVFVGNEGELVSIHSTRQSAEETVRDVEKRRKMLCWFEDWEVVK